MRASSTQPTGLSVCRTAPLNRSPSLPLSAGRALSLLAGARLQTRLMAGQPDPTAGLGRRQPPDRVAIGAAPAGISRPVRAGGEGAQSGAVRGGHLRHPRQSARPPLRCRDDKGRIIEAYGFDLSPLAQRYDEFVKIAAAAKVERDRMRKLRRQATLARRAVAQALEELGSAGPRQRRTPPAPARNRRAGCRRQGVPLLGRADPCRKGTGTAARSKPNAAAAADQTCGNGPHGARKRAPQYKYNLK